MNAEKCCVCKTNYADKPSFNKPVCSYHCYNKFNRQLHISQALIFGSFGAILTWGLGGQGNAFGLHATVVGACTIAFVVSKLGKLGNHSKITEEDITAIVADFGAEANNKPKLDNEPMFNASGSSKGFPRCASLFTSKDNLLYASDSYHGSSEFNPELGVANAIDSLENEDRKTLNKILKAVMLEYFNEEGGSELDIIFKNDTNTLILSFIDDIEVHVSPDIKKTFKHIDATDKYIDEIIEWKKVLVEKKKTDS